MVAETESAGLDIMKNTAAVEGLETDVAEVRAGKEKDTTGRTTVPQDSMNISCFPTKNSAYNSAKSSPEMSSRTYTKSKRQIMRYIMQRSFSKSIMMINGSVKNMTPRRPFYGKLNVAVNLETLPRNLLSFS